MYKRISQEDFFEGSYFLNNGNAKELTYSENKLLYLTNDGKNLKREIITRIKNAKNSIKLCSFLLTDYEIVVRLIRVMTINKIAVFILTQLDDKKINSNFLTSEELFEVRKSNENIHLGHIKMLFENGAHVRAAENLHAKFIIFDRRDVLITSANITKSSLNLSIELGVLCSGKLDSEKYDKLFDLIYQHGTQYEKFVSAGRNKQFITYTDKQISKSWFPKTNNCTLKYTFDSAEQSIYSEIIRIIEESNKVAIIFTYSVVRIDKLPELVEAIKSAVDRGVNVMLFCRAMNYRHDHLQGVSQLRKIGCKVFGDALNHSKGIINENEGFVFTANIDGNHGLKRGFEIGYNLDPEQYIAVRDFFVHKIKTSPSILSQKATIRDVLSWYKRYYQNKNIKTPLREAQYTISFRKNPAFERLVSKNLIYIVYQNKFARSLEIGNSSYKIISLRNTRIVVDPTASRTIDQRNPKYILPYYELKIESR